MEPKINLDTCFKPVAECNITEADDALFALNLADENYYGLNHTAKFIYERLAAGQSIGEVAVAYCSKYQIAAAVSEADVTQTARQLSDAGMLSLI